MKIKHIGISAFLLSAVILFSVAVNSCFPLKNNKEYPFVANAVTYIGTCSDSCKWTLNLKLSTLTVEGSGSTGDFESGENAPWYKYRDGIEKIVVEDGIDTIGANFFSGLYKVKTVVLAPCVTKISDRAFFACSSLRKIEAPSSLLESIGESAFAYCRKLEALPDFSCLKSIGENAFFYCYSLSNVALGYSTAYIGKDAFNCCTSLKTLRIVNYDCDIFDSKDTVYKTTCIEGFNNSTAKAYCDKYAVGFKLLKKIKYINDLSVKLEYESIVYNGEKRKPRVTVEGLKQDKDYILKYKNNTEPGVAAVTVKAAGNTLGEKTLKFKINPEKVKNIKLKKRKKTSLTFSWAKVYGANEYEVYILEKGEWNKLAVTKEASYTATSLKEATSYSFKVRAVCGEKSNKCCGKFSSPFVCCTKPSAPSISSIKILRGGGKLRVNISAVSGVDGYEVFMSTKQNSGYKKVSDIKSTKYPSVVIKDLSNSKKYYFKVRSYIGDGKTVIYSQLSDIKSSGVL